MAVPADHEALGTAMMMLLERGRLLAWTIRLANLQRTKVALAGLRLAPNGRPMRLCVTFALPPSPVASNRATASTTTLARATECRAKSGC